MNYEIYRVEDSVEAGPFDVTSGLNLIIHNGVYVFYKSRWDQPELVYPINRFYILKEV